MLGSPSSAPAAALPSFFFADDADRRIIDEDYLPSWSRASATSPHPAAADAGGAGQAAAGPSSSRSAEVKTNGPGATQKDVGMGRSPVLNPTHLAGLDLDMAESSEALSRAIFGANSASSFASSFKNFQDRSPELAATRKSPRSRRKTLSNESAAPLSFANVASLSVPSPAASPSASRADSSDPGTLLGADRPRTASSKQRASSTAEYAGALPDGLQKRSTSADGATRLHEPRIQAFAKLEFPSFDIYIQKLSVTIGRRPVTPRASGSAAAGPSVPLSLEEAQKAGISLEEYILNLDPSALSRVEPLATPASIKGKEKAVDDPLAHFLIMSPPPHTAPAVANGASTSTSENSQTPSAPSTPHPDFSTFTDVDLGPLRAVSRLHARLYYDFDAGAWAIEVLGRNGVVIEGKWRAKGQKVVLTKKTRIQIAERIFHFVLPTIDVVTVEPNGAVETMADLAQGERQAVDLGKRRTKASATGSKAEHKVVGSLASGGDTVAVGAREGQAGLGPSKNPQAPEPLAPSTPATSVPIQPSLPPLPSSATSKPAPTTSSSRAKPTASSSKPPPPGKMPAGSPAPSPAPPPARTTLLPTPTAASYRPVRSTAKKPPPPAPKAANPAARASSLGFASRADSEEVDEASIEAARQRAAVIAQLLSGGAGPAASGKNSLVRAAAEAKRAGKGKAPMRMAGKAPGKGKGLMPPSRRPSDLGWSDDEDDDSFASSDEDDSDDEDDGASSMDVEIVAAGQGGGKAVVKRSASVSTASASPAPPPPVPSKAPRKAGKMPAKQPRQRRDLPAVIQHEPSASPVPQATDASTRPIAPPALPSTLPALPSISPSPASDTSPALPALNLLPPLPPLKPSPSPAAPTASLPSAPSPATSQTVSKPASAVAAPTAQKTRPSKKKGKTDELPAPAEARKPDSSAATSKTTDADAASPAKPRPSPYAPAPLPPGVPPPDAAPANNRTAKPPYTYASLIAQAISSSPAKKLTLHEIYDWVTDKWPYFLENQKGWQNSIRHNLTPTRGFLKVVREKDDLSGKGSFWEIDPTQMSNFDGHHYRKKPDGPTGGTASNKAKADAAAKAAAAATAQITAAASQAPASTSKTVKKPTPEKASAPSNAPLSKPLPVVVAPIPDSYVRPSTPTDGSQPTDELTAALLADPPIVLHEGKLILNPTIFSSLSETELDELQRQPASAALQTLQAKVVQHFKDKMKNKSVHKFAAAAKATASSSGGKPASSASPQTPASSLPSLPPLPSKAPSTSKASLAAKVVAAKAPRAGLVAAKAPRPAAASKSASSASTGKRAREADIDLTATTAPAKPAKVAKKK
ncbi:Pre-rRNA-processing protein fhl1 [Rhodotorula toruloides]